MYGEGKTLEAILDFPRLTLQGHTNLPLNFPLPFEISH